jgi:hypothetical protein
LSSCCLIHRATCRPREVASPAFLLLLFPCCAVVLRPCSFFCAPVLNHP